MTAIWAERVEQIRPGPHSTVNLCELVEQGKLPQKYCLSTDPERLVPVFLRPEWIGIVLSGDPGRNQARGYTQNHKQGPPVSKRVKLPAHWKELLDEARR